MGIALWVKSGRALALLWALVVLCLCAAVFAEAPPLEVYLIDPCGGCQGGAGPGCGECRLEDEAYLRYRALLTELNQPVRAIRLINLRRNPEAYDLLQERLQNLGHKAFRLPVLMIGDAAFPADGRADPQIRDYLMTGKIPSGINLMEDSGEAAASSPAQASVVYLYSSFCEDCRLIAPWLADAVPSGISLISIDIGSGEGFRVERAVRERFGLSDEDFVIPALVVGEQVLLGSSQIQEGLKAVLPLAHQTPTEALTAPNE